MKNTFPYYYKEFKCIADKCPDTCCAGWDVVLDKQSLERYLGTSGEIGKKLKSVIAVDSDGDDIFVSANGRCPFLMQNNLCEIYIELGEESLCRTCAFFPRHVTDFGSRKETGLSLSCPEAARIIMSKSEPITFYTVEEDGLPEPNSIDPTLYFTLLNVRKTAIDILQNRNYRIEERVVAFLRLCENAHKSVRSGDEVSLEANYEKTPFSPVRAKKAINKYFELLLSLEKLNPDWNNTLEKARTAESCCFMQEVAIEYEHLLVYFVYRYFMTAVFDRNLLSKAKFAALSFIAIKQIHSALPDASNKESRINSIQKFSKEIEHSAENMKNVFAAIKSSRFYSTENLINILEAQL